MADLTREDVINIIAYSGITTVKLSRADLNGADLTGANLTGIKGYNRK